jgi:uncharacterized protein
LYQSVFFTYSFMTRLTLSEIWIYPVKSLGGIRLQSAQVREKGLEHDRRWMLVDEQGRFMTQRTTPSMALFKLKYVDGAIAVTHGNDEIRLPALGGQGKQMQAQIWDDLVEVFEVSHGISAWLSEKLGMACRLVEFPEDNRRQIDLDYAQENENVSLADGFPLLIIGQSSLDDLNGRMEAPVPMNRFRPNLVFSGGKPYEEDAWKEFSVGQNRFRAVKPCARCVLTTVNQDTGEKGREPLLTLSRYRKQEDRILFGENVIPIDHGKIQEGDEIVLF